MWICLRIENETLTGSSRVQFYLLKDLKLNKSTIKSIGDDAAVLNYKSKKVLFFSRGVHFDLS